MEKIGIITLNGYCNFGNRLQNYALTKVLEDKGYSVDTIWSGDEINLKSFIKYILLLYFPFNKKFKREKKLLAFTNKYINKSYLNKSKIDEYGIFIVGSDQVWNYECVNKNINYLIPFATNQKLISYAASLGNYNFPIEYRDIFYKYISRFDYISVREKQGKKILENDVKIKNKKIDVVLDPTLLINMDTWCDMECEPQRQISSKYILCYFLGDLDFGAMESISTFADENNLKIINLLDKFDPFYCSGPEEFLYLVHHATLVCTDSFHSSVFSFIYNVPFVTFKRQGNNDKMYSRIEDFLNIFNLKDRKYNGKCITNKNLNNDYKESYKILEKLRIKSLNFIDESLNIDSRSEVIL